MLNFYVLLKMLHCFNIIVCTPLENCYPILGVKPGVTQLLSMMIGHPFTYFYFLKIPIVYLRYYIIVFEFDVSSLSD